VRVLRWMLALFVGPVGVSCRERWKQHRRHTRRKAWRQRRGSDRPLHRSLNSRYSSATALPRQRWQRRCVVH
jgi:hypothetical protein